MSEDQTIQIRGDVKYGALTNQALHQVLKQFGAAAFRRCSVMMEFEHFLNRVVQTLPKGKRMTCLEIGTYNGISAIVLSQYFDRVICTSVDEHPEELLKQQIVDCLGIKNIRFFDCKNNQEKGDLIRGLDFDFCYQDGDHIHDTNADFELARKCGRILFHEYWPLQPPVWNLVESLPQNEVMRAQFDCFAYWTNRDRLWP